MKMKGAVYEELDEAKSEIDKLKEQYRVKAELAEGLKRAHNNEVGKNKEASSKLEKLAQELNRKDHEISSARQMFEELKSNLAQKESIVKHLSASHDKLRFDCSEKLKKCEEENKALASALDDANAKNVDQEQQIRALKQEIERLLTFSEKKCSESENKKTTKAREGFDAREDVFFKLDEEKRKFEDQLKWKKEQFVHLEEAHKKLRSEFKTREKEWEKEKNTLLDGISSLQMDLESQTRISQDLECRLEMCNQALSRAESKRKLLEVQLSESRTSFDSVCAEYDEARLSFENLMTQRDQEIATLRSSSGTKEILYKETEYQFKKLEQEKKELSVSLKELQETQIREAGFSYSSSKLQNKIKSLEQAHKGCSVNLKAKEFEWWAQTEKLSEELNSCRLELKNRDTSLNELNRELEACDSLILELEMLNQETSLILLVLKSEFSEARRGLADNNNSCMNLKNKEMEENMCELVGQLERKKAALTSVRKDLDYERRKVVVLSEKVQTLEKLQFPLQKEVERLNDMLEESKTCRVESEEQVIQIQSDLERVHDALDRANEELYDKFFEANEIEFELQIWKSIAEQLEVNLKRNLQMRREVEASLFVQMEVELNVKQQRENLSHRIEEKEKTIDDLRQQLVEASETVNNSKTVQNAEENEALARVEAKNDENTPETMNSKTTQNAEENEALARVEAENDENTPETMNSKTTQNAEENETLARVDDENSLETMNSKTTQNAEENEALARVEVENDENTPETTERIYQLVEEKDQRICDLQQLVASLEKEFESSTVSFSSKLTQMQKERNVLRESWEKIKSDEVSKEMETQEKNIVIVELENDLRDLRQRVEKQEKALFDSEKKIREIQVELEKKEAEVRKLECELETKIRIITSEKKIKNLTLANEKLASTMCLMSEKMDRITVEDVKLMENLGKIVEAFDDNSSDDEDESVKENVNIILSSPSSSRPLMKRVEGIHDERSPLRAIN